ncbi:unnamed protein product [Symbiodinium natans]|uniref:Uncharacterized protein n=1 Tax=Symbiodinium natans TaxID=878477 RepID=A0A812H8F2_9DINO|nr:unnamed protein product [Symbiodinium natans]
MAHTSDDVAFDVTWHPPPPPSAHGSAGNLLQASHISKQSEEKMREADIRAHFMRRGHQGLGYEPEDQNAASSSGSIKFVPAGNGALDHSSGSDSHRGGLRQVLDGAGGSEHLMLLVANFGAMDREVQGEKLCDYLTRNNHLVLTQEAAGTVYPMLAKLRAMACSVSPHALTSILAGGSGRKAVRNLYPDHDGLIPRPWAQIDRSHAIRFHACAISWHHLQDATFLRRAGLDFVRAMSVHYESWAAKKPDSVRYVLASLWRLCRRDNIRLVGGDFDRASGLLEESLQAISASVTGFSYQLQHGRSPEIAAIILNWPKTEPLLMKKRADRLDAAAVAAFGLEESWLFEALRGHKRSPAEMERRKDKKKAALDEKRLAKKQRMSAK